MQSVFSLRSPDPPHNAAISDKIGILYISWPVGSSCILPARTFACTEDKSRIGPPACGVCSQNVWRQGHGQLTRPWYLHSLIKALSNTTRFDGNFDGIGTAVEFEHYQAYALLAGGLWPILAFGSPRSSHGKDIPSKGSNSSNQVA